MPDEFQTHLCLIHLEFFLADSHSLKDKRMILRRLKDRLRNRFNVSLAEIGYQDLWQRALVAVAMVSADPAPLRQMAERIRQEAEQIAPGELSQFTVEYF
jgi:uncharacterized protein YlxP (DUF503 family)